MSESDAAKQAAVAWIREQMDHYGLTFDDLVDAGCFVESDDGPDSDAAAPAATPAGAVAANTNASAPESAAKPRALYRNAMGQTWDGTGEYPDWLQRAVNAGQSIDFYRVD
ncbi:histone-like nucleoid-structuring protein [Cupriavidus pauculus]|jgi:DNA-binding protein H-NS|uniref:histone-like nucleoid-structuring protein n=1 Tax=Cupriavidus pauculus TaxID=82633 RepID=UPI003857DE4F